VSEADWRKYVAHRGVPHRSTQAFHSLNSSASLVRGRSTRYLVPSHRRRGDRESQFGHTSLVPKVTRILSVSPRHWRPPAAERLLLWSSIRCAGSQPRSWSWRNWVEARSDDTGPRIDFAKKRCSCVQGALTARECG
jgi:hypothetical protein